MAFMSELATTVHPPEGIIYGDESALEQKLGDFIMAGSTGLHIIYDFDRTLTVRKPDVDDDITTWNILRDHLPPTAQAEYKALYDKYRALEIAETMTEADAAEWWTAILDLFVQNRINLQEVEADFLHRASVRPGTQELFGMCDANTIPTVIMSAGIRDVIDVWGKAYGIKPTLTIATALRLDEAGRIIGWEENTLVHALNKNEAVESFALAEVITQLAADNPDRRRQLAVTVARLALQGASVLHELDAFEALPEGIKRSADLQAAVQERARIVIEAEYSHLLDATFDADEVETTAHDLNQRAQYYGLSFEIGPLLDHADNLRHASSDPADWPVDDADIATDGMEVHQIFAQLGTDESAE